MLDRPQRWLLDRLAQNLDEVVTSPLALSARVCNEILAQLELHMRQPLRGGRIEFSRLDPPKGGGG